MLVLHFNMQGEDSIAHTYDKYLEQSNVKCHLCHFSQSVCEPLCSTNIHLNSIIEHTYSKIVISALERQES